MKKQIIIIGLIILSIFIFVGCTTKKPEKVDNSKVTKIESNKDTYIKYVKKLQKIKKSEEELPFDVDVIYEKMDEEVRYQVIIDNPKGEITDVRALAIHDKQTDDVFPSIGIFDKKSKLIPNEKPSGIILVGYIPYEGKIDDLKVEMKVLIEYKYENNLKTSYYLTKK